MALLDQVLSGGRLDAKDYDRAEHLAAVVTATMQRQIAEFLIDPNAWIAIARAAFSAYSGSLQ